MYVRKVGQISATVCDSSAKARCQSDEERKERGRECLEESEIFVDVQ